MLAFVFSQPAAPADAYLVIDVGKLSGDSNVARGLNSFGQVVGMSGSLQGTGTRAFVWTPNEGAKILGTLPSGSYSRALAINDALQVVGSYNTATSVRAFLWTPSGGMQDLGTLPDDSSSEAYGINNAGQVVGYSSGPGGVRAFVWTASGGMQDLGTLPGGNYSRALAINESGQVVGSSTSSVGTRAFLWTASGGMQDLNALIPAGSGLVLSEALAIHDLGLIVASGKLGDPQDGHHDDHEGPTNTFILISQ